MAKNQIKNIKALDGFAGVKDADVATRGAMVLAALTGNSHFPNPPADLTAFKSALDTFNALIAQSASGTKSVIASKNKQRQTVAQMLRLLARYVEVTSNGDMSVFQTSGFQAASTTKVKGQPLSEKIRKIEHAANSGQVIAWVNIVHGALSYEIRYGVSVNGAVPATWTSQAAPMVKSPVIVTGLTPGTAYQFQARAVLKTGYTDYSDAVTFICT
jgi:hypothetical protein